MTFHKSFKYWTAEDVELTFGIKEVYEHPLLDEWLAFTTEMPDNDQAALEDLRQTALRKVSYWNEAALKFFFIGPVVQLINFAKSDVYNGFLEQQLSIEIDDQVSTGNIDFMVAMGKQKPRAPYFMLHEYKPESHARLDPQGQLLIAMMAARKRNGTTTYEGPVYGMYVMGRLWFFVVFVDDRYIISPAFDSTKADDLASIYHALAFVKQFVEEEVATTT